MRFGEASRLRCIAGSEEIFRGRSVPVGRSADGLGGAAREAGSKMLSILRI